MSEDRDAAISDSAVAVRLRTFYALAAAVRRGVDFKTAFEICNEGWELSEAPMLRSALTPKGGFVGPQRNGVARDPVSHRRGPKEVRFLTPRRDAS